MINHVASNSLIMQAVELFSSMLEKFFYLNMILFNLFNATVQFDDGIQCQSSFKYKLI